MLKIFVCEDDEDLASELQTALSLDGHSVDVVHCGAEAREQLARNSYDVIIFDWELPDTTGPELCKEFRGSGGTTPVLLLTGKSKTSEKETGLDSGADDYLTKPFELLELRARLRALTRRADRPFLPNVMTRGDLVIDPSRFYATKSGEALQLVPKEFALLEFFMRNPGQVFSADNLISHVWTADEEVSPDTLRTHIMNLRKKIDRQGQDSMLETVHGVGYRFRG